METCLKGIGSTAGVSSRHFSPAPPEKCLREPSGHRLSPQVHRNQTREASLVALPTARSPPLPPSNSVFDSVFGFVFECVFRSVFDLVLRDTIFDPVFDPVFDTVFDTVLL